MLRVDRPDLDEETTAILAARADAVTAETDAGSEWTAFKRDEPEAVTALRTALGRLAEGKCVYCDWADGTQIEHHWPKAPHPKLNAGRGTPTRMYDWDNLLWSCGFCNGFECKGSHMRWDADDVPLLIDPSRGEQDPLRLIDFDVDPDSRHFGKAAAAFAPGSKDGERGAYTIRRLKLNRRADLLRERQTKLRTFLMCEAAIHAWGPDFELPEGRPLRGEIAALLAPASPHLGPVRQLLQREPERWARLVAVIPELAEAAASWNRPVFEQPAAR